MQHSGEADEQRPGTGRDKLVLASSSKYRQELLARFGLPFEVDSPDVDESPLAEESPADLALRLAVAKARVVAERWPAAIVIGADQTASFDGRVLGKPATRQRAIAHLAAFSSKAVEFHTGMAVVHATSGQLQKHLDRTVAHFRPLSTTDIEHYVDRDRPFDCAGGIKFESAGTLLLTAVETRDPTAGIGLPLIALGAALRSFGLDPLNH